MSNKNNNKPVDLEAIDQQIKDLQKQKRELKKEQKKAEKERIENLQKTLGKTIMEMLSLQENEIPYLLDYVTDKRKGIKDSIRHRTANSLENNEDI